MKFQPLFHSFFLFYLYTTSISCLSSKHRDIHHNRYKLKHNRNHNHNHNHNQNYSGDLPGCDFCEEILTELDNFLAVNTTWDDIQDIADGVCLAVLAGGNCVPPFYDWQCTEVCKQSVYEFSNEVQFLVIQYIDPALLCYSIGFDCPVPPPTPEPTPIPDILEDNMARNASGIGYIVQIPDIHVDPWAKPYTVANCGMPVCCRESDDNHSYPNATYGGYYGSYLKCDASPLVVESMWDFIKKNITHKYGDDIDFAIWVGDAVPHDVNNQSRWTHLQILKNTNQDLKKTFGDIPVYPILGNHEGMPVNQFEGPGYDDWLLNEMGSQWAQWIDNEYVQNDTILPSQQMSYCGYYTTLIRPGFRLIALHTGYVEHPNFYLTLTHEPGRDMASQLSWFKSTLDRARELDEIVFIIQHYPLHGFDHSLQNDYYSVFREYSDIIVNIIAGHEHSDRFSVYGAFPPNISQFDINEEYKYNYNYTTGDKHNYKRGENLKNSKSEINAKTNTSVPYAVAFVTGSVTTYQGRNPSFRVYSYNRTTGKFIDFLQYRFDLAKSNDLKKPLWYEAYTMKSEYGLSSLDAPDILNLVENMATNDDLFNKYQYNFNNGYPTILDRNATICKLMTATHNEFEYCKTYLYPFNMTLEEYSLKFSKQELTI